MTTYLDGDRLRSWLETQLDIMLLQARARHEADGEADPTALRMDGGVTNMQLILNKLSIYEVTPGKTRTPIKDIRTPAKARVQRRGQGTSFEAAITQTGARSQLLYKVIYGLLLRKGPMTDDEIYAFLEARGKTVTQNSLRPRRKELTDNGWVRDSGVKRPSANGGPAIVWEAVPDDS